jgi:hypothetical protein
VTHHAQLYALSLAAPHRLHNASALSGCLRRVSYYEHQVRVV